MSTGSQLRLMAAAKLVSVGEIGFVVAGCCAPGCCACATCSGVAVAPGEASVFALSGGVAETLAAEVEASGEGVGVAVAVSSGYVGLNE